MNYPTLSQSFQPFPTMGKITNHLLTSPLRSFMGFFPFPVAGLLSHSIGKARTPQQRDRKDELSQDCFPTKSCAAHYLSLEVLTIAAPFVYGFVLFPVTDITARFVSGLLHFPSP